AFVSHLFAPALLATSICVAAVALVERARLRGPCRSDVAGRRPLSADELLAAGALAASGLAGSAAPWLGAPSWLALPAVTLAWLAVAGSLRRPVPKPPVPGRVCIQVAALLVAVSGASGPLHPRGYLKPWLPVAVVATMAATACLWLRWSLA